MNIKHIKNTKASYIKVRTPKQYGFMVRQFVGASVMTSILVMPILLVVAFLTGMPIKVPTALMAIVLLTIVFALVAMIVGFILKRLYFVLDSIFKYLVLFVVSTVSAFITIGVLELGFVTYTRYVLIGRLVVSIIAGVILAIYGKYVMPKKILSE